MSSDLLRGHLLWNARRPSGGRAGTGGTVGEVREERSSRECKEEKGLWWLRHEK